MVQYISRRYALVVPTADMLEGYSPHTDIRAIIHSDLPALNTLGVLAADNSLSAVEVHSAAESCQANVEFKTQITEHYVCDFVVQGPRRNRYRAIGCNAAVYRRRSVRYECQRSLSVVSL